MNTYSVIVVLFSVVITAAIALPLGVFFIWLALKAGDWASRLSIVYGDLYQWMVYLPLAFIALTLSITIGAFVFSYTLGSFSP